MLRLRVLKSVGAGVGEISRKVVLGPLLMGSRPIALAALGRERPTRLGYYTFPRKFGCERR